MRALVYTQPNELQLQQRPMPEAAPGEVVLEIEAVGICGSDMHAWHGHDPRRKPGLVLGHEFVGRIVESAAAGFAVATRFTGNPLITCGVCDYCVQGRNNLCSERTMVGMTRPGAYAEFMSIPAASLIAMPQDLSDRVAALTEPAATAWHAIDLTLLALSRPIHECRVLVIGGGGIGMVARVVVRRRRRASTEDAAVACGCAGWRCGAWPSGACAVRAVRPGGCCRRVLAHARASACARGGPVPRAGRARCVALRRPVGAPPPLPCDAHLRGGDGRGVGGATHRRVQTIRRRGRASSRRCGARRCRPSPTRAGPPPSSSTRSSGGSRQALDGWPGARCRCDTARDAPRTVMAAQTKKALNLRAFRGGW